MDEARLYTAFESAVAPGTEPAPATGTTVVQYGFPGSGSTFVWQVLNALFGDAKKTHECPPLRDDYRLVATIRDFRDVLCTYFRRADLPVCRDSIDFIVNRLGGAAFRELYKVSDTWTDERRILWLRYERFAHDFDYVFVRIESFFGIELSEEQKEHCRRRYSLQANLVRTREADALCNRAEARGWLDERWKQYTVDGINGLHITGRGAVGKWRRTIPEELHEHLNEALRAPLERYGYL